MLASNTWKKVCEFPKLTHQHEAGMAGRWKNISVYWQETSLLKTTLLIFPTMYFCYYKHSLKALSEESDSHQGNHSYCFLQHLLSVGQLPPSQMGEKASAVDRLKPHLFMSKTELWVQIPEVKGDDFNDFFIYLSRRSILQWRYDFLHKFFWNQHERSQEYTLKNFVQTNQMCKQLWEGIQSNPFSPS